MNNKGCDDTEEFWDNEIDDGDEDDNSGFDGNIDANNDETFDNTAEWNEDEHEELIARDLILSHTHQRNNRNIHGSSNNNNNNSNNTSNHHNTSNYPSRLDVEHRFGSRGTNDGNLNQNIGKETQHFALFASTIDPSTGQASGWNVPRLTNDDDIMTQLRLRSAQEQPRTSTSNETSWQDAQKISQRMQLQQLQQQAQDQLRLLSQSRLLIDQDLRLQQIKSQQQRLQLQQATPETIFGQNESTSFNSSSVNRQEPVQQPRVLTVDELERQLLKTSINQSPHQVARTLKPKPEPSKRAGWSPFGSKDLFSTDDPMLIPTSLIDLDLLHGIQSHPLSLEQQQLVLEQHKLLQQQQQLLQQQLQQQQLQQQQLQQLALLKQQKHQQQRQQHQLNQRRQMEQLQHLQNQHNSKPEFISPVTRCITVEELERQLLANRSTNTKESESKKTSDKENEPQLKDSRGESTPKHHVEENRSRNYHDKRNGERQDRYERHNNNYRELNDSRDQNRDRRDNRNYRDHLRHHKKRPTIVPPQVQLGVINAAKRAHSITAKHTDEFLQDRMPTSAEGFKFMRHSDVSDIKSNHNGVLTVKERDWLTKIQEKIQVDYDDNIDQDYYYLLYFNRSSMSDEASQKPSGPGVFDRRFIPRERLLYNSGIL